MTTRIMVLTDETFGSSDRSNHGLILDETRILGKWSPWRDTALSAQWRSPFWRDHLPSLWTVPVLGTVKVKKLCGDSPITSHHGLRNHTNPLYYGEKRCPQWNNLIHYNHHALIWFYSNSTTKIHDSVKSWIRFFFSGWHEKILLFLMDSTTIYWRLTAEPCGSRRTPSARRKTRLLRRCDLTWQWCLTWLDGFNNDWLVVLTCFNHLETY